MEKNGPAAGQAAQRREAYGCYAKARVCLSLGEEMRPKARLFARRALDIYKTLRQDEEDRAIIKELLLILKAGQ